MFRWFLALAVSVSTWAWAEGDEAEAAGEGDLETVVQSKAEVDVRRVAGSAHVFTQADMERHEYDDVHNLLRGVPGVYLRSEDGFGLRPNIGLRGASSDRSSKVTLMEDEVLFAPAPYSAPSAYFFPLLTRMVGAELYKGAGSIRFGPNTIGGAFNLRTRAVPEGFVGELDLGVGPYGGSKVHGVVGHGNARFGVLVEGVRLSSDGFKVLDGGGNTGFDKNEVMGKARWSHSFSTGKQSAEVKLTFANEVANETYLGLLGQDFENTPFRRYAGSQNDVIRWERYAAQLSHQLEVGSFQLKSSAYWHRLHRNWTKFNRFRKGPGLFDLLAGDGSGDDEPWVNILRGDRDSLNADESLLLEDNDRYYLSRGIQTKGVWTSALGSAEHRLEFGARLHHDELARVATDVGYQMFRGTLVPDGQPDSVNNRSRIFTRAFSFYAQEELTWGGWLFAPGLRAEVISTGSYNALKDTKAWGGDVVWLPGLGVVKNLSNHFSLLAGVHQGFSPVAPGQPDEVRPELSWNYEAGARFRSRPFKAELIGFLNDYFNIVGECQLSTGCFGDLLNRQFNGGRAHVYGLEASAQASLPKVMGTQLRLEGAYTLSRSEFLSDFKSAAPQFGTVQKYDEVPYIPQHMLSLSLRAERGPLSASLSGHYTSGMRERAGRGPIPEALLAEPNLLVDVALHRKLGASSEVYLTVNNLFNATYVAAHRPFGARPGAPINGMLGFKHRF